MTVGDLSTALLDYADEVIRTGKPVTALLPLMFRLRGKPMTLDWSHFMFAPMYRVVNAPRRMMYRTGRQVSKSTNQAASQVLRARIQRDYRILTVMPLQEQVRKFSANYVQPFIQTSPIRKFLRGPGDNVFQRSVGALEHASTLYFSYSSGDPNRIRGIAADELDVDECQDMDFADLPIIEACMSASPFKFVRYTGTPKTFDNTIQLLWEESSQAIWHIPCDCGHVNRCSADGDLLKMLGAETLVCAKCERPANSRAGYFVHDYPDRLYEFAAYHVPQPILPMHYESPKDWQLILDFQRTRPTYAFYNEILGEPFDSGAKLITREDLANAASIPAVPPKEMERNRYISVFTGVDWGGRGKERTSDAEEFISNTAIAIAGMNPDGTIDIPWLYRVPYSVDPSAESQLVLQAAALSMSDYIALDYGGQGNVQESVLRGHGWPADRIVPFSYSIMSPTKPIVFFSGATHAGVRSSYTLDKSRSILLLCELIKRGYVRLPKSQEFLNTHLSDFLSIYYESTDTPSGSPRRLIKRMYRRTDDIVHAINFAVMGLYHATNRWPDIARMFIETAPTIK